MDRFELPDINSEMITCVNCYTKYVYDEGVVYKDENFCSEECSGGTSCDICEAIKSDEEIMELDNRLVCEDCGYSECISCEVVYKEHDGFDEEFCSKKCYNDVNGELKCEQCGNVVKIEDNNYCSKECYQKGFLKISGFRNYIRHNDNKYISRMDKERLDKLNKRYVAINFAKYNIKQEGTICMFESGGLNFVIGLSCMVIVHQKDGKVINEKLIYNFNDGYNLTALKNLRDNNSDKKLRFILDMFINIFDLRRSIDKYL